MLIETCLVVAAAASFLAGFFVARYSPRKPSPLTKQSLLALESIARTLAADVQGHSGTVRRAETRLDEAEGGSVRHCVRDILEAGAELQARLHDAEERLSRQAAILEQRTRAAHTDALTQTFNRRALDERLRAAFERSVVEGCPSSLLMIDVDRFKRVNDRFGHLAGDAVLKAVAKRILAAAPPGAFVARFGGEEFAILFEGVRAQERRDAAEAIRSAIGEEKVLDRSRSIVISASAGLADTCGAESLDRWIERTDAALYRAKERGRDRGFVRLEGALTPLVAEGGTGAGSPKPEETDTITGLMTRDAFADVLDRCLASGRSGAVVVARLDGYSQLMERAGFRAAESALQGVARAIRATAREGDPAARLALATFALGLIEAPTGQPDLAMDRLRETFDANSPPIGDEILSLELACLDLRSEADGKALVARCVASPTDGWFSPSA